MTSVILINPKYPHNVAQSVRACACFGVGQMFWTGDRVLFPEGARIPREERLRDYRTVEFERTARPFDRLPDGMVPVCVELMPNAQPLTYFDHPPMACYVFGPEDKSVPQVVRALCHRHVYIPSYHCLNLAAALNVVLAHRAMQFEMAGAEPLKLKETRGEIAIPGWEGR